MNGILYMDVSILEDKKLFEKSMTLVSEERRKKVKNFKNQLPARLSLGAGVLLAIAMEQYGIRDRINDMEYSEYGKPYIRNADFHFSLSHSGTYAICVYADKPIGVDLQNIKDGIPKHTKKILSEEEEHYMNSSEEKEKNILFYRIWSMKESLIKWDGRGLRIPLQNITVVEQKQLKKELYFDHKRVFFHEADLFLPEYACCICSEKILKFEDITEVTANFLTKY